MFIAKCAQAVEQFAWRRIEPAFALDRFDDDRGNARRFKIGLEQHLERFQRMSGRVTVAFNGKGQAVNA